MNYFRMIIILLLSLPCTCLAIEEIKDTPHYDVVTEYVRSLGAIHNLQQMANQEVQDDIEKNNSHIGKLMTGIRNSTRVKLELHTSISALEKMYLKKPFETLLPTTIQFYKLKVALHDELITISKMFIDQTPKPGVDYSNMVARMPEITASLEYIDESIFQLMVLVFGLLIDEKPDSKGHMSHLNITKAQRQKLIDNIGGLFGESLDKQNKNWTVGSVSLLKTWLLKDYKCTDE